MIVKQVSSGYQLHIPTASAALAHQVNIKMFFF